MCVIAALALATTALHSQQPQQPAPGTPTALPSVPAREPSWAFPVQAGQLPAEPAGPKSVPGSTKKYTPQEIDDLLNPPDWFPDEHKPAPPIVQKGHGMALACGSCHLMSGLGHPESSDLTGLSAPYIVQQMIDFKNGTRKDPTGKRMNGIAMEATEMEIREAAEYFAALPRKPFQKVMEAAMVPKTFLGNGRMRYVDPAGGMEPIGQRIISVPEDQARARMRDPNSGFISYVPPGSIARGKTIVETGGGKTTQCTLCHGQDLKGIAAVPRLAGMHPVYTARQLLWFKDGTRAGTDAVLMKPWAATLNIDDIIAVSAYLATLAP
jgi:cytochrome c553